MSLLTLNAKLNNEKKSEMIIASVLVCTGHLILKTMVNNYLGLLAIFDHFKTNGPGAIIKVHRPL